MLDVMVLGNSLHEHGMKAKKLLCINDDTQENSISNLMRAFWEFVPVQHVEIPSHLQGSEQSRLQGVYSKLQTVKLFSSGPLEQKRLLLIDADTLFRTNNDDLFAHETPAGVMRGEADSCLWAPRPSHTFFQKGGARRPGGSHPPMKGGINGGLVLFEPSADTHEDMMNELEYFVPTTKMAEQEFFSWYWGRTGSWHAMHKKDNFQIHQMYFSSPEPPPGQDRQSSFSYMVEHPQEIRVFHFSADRKPSQILIEDMSSVQGWLTLEDHLKDHARYMLEAHGARGAVLAEHPEWVDKIEKLLRDAYVEWYEAWKRTYANVLRFVLETAYNKMDCVWTDEEEHVHCPACGEGWNTQEMEQNSLVIRDHLLFNCPRMASQIKIPVKHHTNLRTFFFVPCGPQVESKLLYLAEVYKWYVGLNATQQPHNLPPLDLTPSEQPQILLANYLIPSSVLATTEDKGVDASTVDGQPEVTVKAMKRRYQRGMDTLLKPGQNIFSFTRDRRRADDWLKTLETVHESCKWLIDHEKNITEFAQSKAGASSSSSSSSRMTATAEEPGLEPATVTPPWRQASHVCQPSLPRPPPPSVTRQALPPPPPPPPGWGK